MEHPWTGLVEHHALWLGALWALTVVLMVVLMVQGRGLERGAAPRGVVSFELSWNRAGAEAVLASWCSRVWRCSPATHAAETPAVRRAKKNGPPRSPGAARFVRS